MLTPPADPTCARCGYKLRGIHSDRCPECGHAREWTTVRVHDTIQFMQAIDVLKDAGIEFRSSSTTTGIEGVVGATDAGPIEGGFIRYPRAAADRIYDLMHDAGLPIGPPIVDRHDPECPACGINIRPIDVERCPHCDTRVQWIDIDESDAPTADSCHACGYDLNQLSTDRCPECGEEVAVDLEHLHTQAIREAHDEDDGWPLPARAALQPLPSVIAAALTMVFAVVVARLSIPNLPMIPTIAGAVLALAVYAWIRRRLRTTSV